MLSWSQQQSETQNLIGDTTSAQLTAIKRDMNMGITKVRSVLIGSSVMEDEYTQTWPISTQSQPVPSDFFRPKTAVWQKSNIKYVLKEVQSPLIWQKYNEVTTNTATIPTHYFIRNRAGRKTIEIWPKNSAASDTDGFLLVYIMDQPDLTVDDLTVSACGFTNDSATVTSAAGFTSIMVDNKRWLKADPATGGDGLWYRMITFTNTSSIDLERKYEGLTDASVDVTVAQISLLPPDTHILPCYFAAANFFYRKRDFSKGNTMMALFESGRQDAVRLWNQKSTLQTGSYGRNPYRFYDPNTPPRNVTSSA